MQGRPCGAITTGTFADIAMLSIGVDAVSLAVNIFFVARAIHHNLEKNKSTFSATTYRLHRQLTISLIIQVKNAYLSFLSSRGFEAGLNRGPK